MSEHEVPGVGGQDDDDYFAQMEDAGNSDLMNESEAAATIAVVNMEHRKEAKEIARDGVYGEPDLVKRARKLRDLEAIKFVHFQASRANDPTDVGVKAKKDSLMNRHAVYDALFDFGSGQVPYPHYDTFRGRLVDHEGQTFSARTIRTRELVRALDKAGMESPTDKEVADSLRSWALDHQRDSLKTYFEQTIVEWDGVSRLETLLIDLFKPFDTELTRLIGKYFWLSLYNRVVNPGSQAPITIALIGAQDVGKSYFSLLLCRLLTGDKTIGPIMLDLGAKNYNPFLRNITGKSIIAVVGEMAGFRKGDMLRIKEFVTKTEDDLDFKFEDSIVKPRQWITVMDGNSYEGLQKDDTGNRRFYPLFVNQIEDLNGKPAWASGIKADFSNFEADMWQVMAECRAWMEKHGEGGYSSLISQANGGVAGFSDGEMKQARGVQLDDNIEANLKNVLIGCDWRQMAGNAKIQGLFTSISEINSIFLKISRKEPYSKHLAPHMSALQMAPKQLGGRGYFIAREDIGGDGSVEALRRKIWRHQCTDEDQLNMTDAEVDIDVDRMMAVLGGGF